jgi:hypothetical protein
VEIEEDEEVLEEEMVVGEVEILKRKVGVMIVVTIEIEVLL